MWELYQCGYYPIPPNTHWAVEVRVVGNGHSISVSSSEPDNWDGVDAIRYVGNTVLNIGRLSPKFLLVLRHGFVRVLEMNGVWGGDTLRFADNTISKSPLHKT